jgi:hypothetical protein
VRRGRRLASLVWALAASLAPGISRSSHAEAPALISPEQAERAAWSGFTANLRHHPEPLRQAGQGAVAAPPLRVERLDRPGDFYYIVPFTRQGRTTLLVLVDARTGAFKEAAYRQADERPYPNVDEARARRILGDRQSGGRGRLDLVWKPSEPSQSPYEPLWRFELGDKVWYVDQLGHLLDRINDPAMKGGGPPGGSGRR